MHILFLTPRLPYPPNRGGEIIVFNWLRLLSRHHSISLVSFYDDPSERDLVRQLEPYCGYIDIVPRRAKWNGAIGREVVFAGKSYSMARHFAPEMRLAIERCLNRKPVDVVQLETFHMGQYLACLQGIPTVLEMHNVTWQVWERMAKVARFPRNLLFRFEAQRVRRDEALVCQKVKACLAVSFADLRQLENAIGENVNARVVSPGVDTDLLVPSETVKNGNEIIFVGSMHYVPNIDSVEYFCKEILPLIRREVPDVHFTIVGMRPSPEVQRLTKIANVTVTGFVEEVAPYYARAAVSVIPLQIAGGVRMKILEGLALGMPMVSTSISCEGLGLEHECELLIADGAEQFATATVRLLRDERLRRRLAAEARQTAVERFSWDAAVKRLEEVYVQVTETQRH